MTVTTLMITPSIWMQKTFFQYAETAKGSRIGETPSSRRADADTSIRVAALAHAVFQALYAHFMLFPLVIVSVLTVVVTPTTTGFISQEGMLVERIALAFLSAVASLTVPIVASIATAIHPDELNDKDSFSVKFPIYAHAFFMGFTLPTLSDLTHHMAEGFADTLNRQMQPSLAGAALAAAIRWLGGSNISKDTMAQIDVACFQWRLHLPTAINDIMAGDLSNYAKAFDLTSPQFTQAVLASVASAASQERR